MLPPTPSGLPFRALCVLLALLVACGEDPADPVASVRAIDLLERVPDVDEPEVSELTSVDFGAAPGGLPEGWLEWRTPRDTRVVAFALESFLNDLLLDVEVVHGGLRLLAVRPPRSAPPIPPGKVAKREWIERQARPEPERGDREVRREVFLEVGAPQPPPAELPVRLTPDSPEASSRILVLVEFLDPKAQLGRVRLTRKGTFERQSESPLFTAPDYTRGPVVGRAGIVGDDRRALVLPVGSARAIALDPAALDLSASARLRWSLGALAAGRPTKLVPLTFDLTLSSAEATLVRQSWTLDLIADERARHWQDVELPLPADLGGGPLTLHLEASGGRAGDAVALANLELVQPSPAEPPPTILLVSLDTVRRDRVGEHGAVGSLTPHLDAFAEQAVVFEGATTVAPFTLPSHATVFSGLLPTEHGGETFTSPIARDVPLLTERLDEVGYRTAAFTGGGFLSPDFGFVRGFDRYTIHDPLRTLEYIPPRPSVAGAAALELSAPDWEDTLRLESAHDLGLPAVEAWLERYANEPRFLFLHTYAAHQYQPPQRIYDEELAATRSDLTMHPHIGKLSDARFSENPPSEADVEHFRKLYDACVRHADEEFGAFLAYLDESGLAENSYVVVFSDHGEQLFEHEQFGHSNHVWETLLAVPLMVRGPGIEPGGVPEPVSLLDLGPTLAQFAGVELNSETLGRSLFLPDGEGWQVAGHPVLSEAGVFAEVDRGMVRFDALVLGQHKLIRHYVDEGIVRDQLFDLAQDPAERLDLAASEPELLARLAERLEAWRALVDARAPGAEASAELTGATKAQLEDLGYL